MVLFLQALQLTDVEDFAHPLAWLKEKQGTTSCQEMVTPNTVGINITKQVQCSVCVCAHAEMQKLVNLKLACT